MSPCDPVGAVFVAVAAGAGFAGAAGFVLTGSAAGLRGAGLAAGSAAARGAGGVSGVGA
jgi:hypothetical protein